MANEETITDAQPRDPYAVLGLLPSAPLDLVMEVYWAQVRPLQRVPEDEAAERLHQLNDAYGYIAKGDVSPLKPDGHAVAGGDPDPPLGLLARLFARRRPAPPRPDPARLLAVSLTASDQVVNIAHAFWRRRLRGRYGPDAAPALRQIDDAYEELCNRPPPVAASEPQEPASAASTAPEPDRGPSTFMRIAAATGSFVGRLAARVGAWLWGLTKAWASDPLFETRRGRRPQTLPSAPQSIAPAAESPASAGPLARKPVRTRTRSRSAQSTPRRAGSPAPGPPAVQPPSRPSIARNGGPCLEINDRAIPIGAQALTIGTDPAADVTIDAQSVEDCISVNIWAEDSRVVLHAVDHVLPVRVNGVSAIWAFLEDGDEITVGDRSFRFQQ